MRKWLWARLVQRQHSWCGSRGRFIWMDDTAAWQEQGRNVTSKYSVKKKKNSRVLRDVQTCICREVEELRSKEKQLGMGKESLQSGRKQSQRSEGHLGDKAKRAEPVTCNPMCHAVMVKWMSAQLQEATSSMSQPIRREESKLQSVCSAVSVCVSSRWTCHSCWDFSISTIRSSCFWHTFLQVVPA